MGPNADRDDRDRQNTHRCRPKKSRPRRRRQARRIVYQVEGDNRDQPHDQQPGPAAAIRQTVQPIDISRRHKPQHQRTPPPATDPERQACAQHRADPDRDHASNHAQHCASDNGDRLRRDGNEIMDDHQKHNHDHSQDRLIADCRHDVVNNILHQSSVTQRLRGINCFYPKLRARCAVMRQGERPFIAGQDRLIPGAIR